MSDQCVAMVHDGLIVKSEDQFLLATPPERKGQMAAAVVYQDKPMLPGADLIADQFIVKVPACSVAREFPPFACTSCLSEPLLSRSSSRRVRASRCSRTSRSRREVIV